MIKKAVIYARYSCSKQRDASIEDQIRVCRQWCEQNSYIVVAEYKDEAQSGRTDARPAFQEMIANAGESDIVLVYMMDRFSRDIYDAPIYKKKLLDKGVKVVSATEALPDGPESLLLMSLYEALAAMESEHISERVKRGMKGNALKCMHNGVYTYGYTCTEDGRYVINEEEAEIVREVFSRRIKREAVNSIVCDLRRRGIRPHTGRKPSYGFVYNMLKNDKYTGVYKYGDVHIEGGIPAIITKQEFFMAQNVTPTREKANENWGDFLLTGKALCGKCFMDLSGTSGHGYRGKKYEYYKCTHCKEFKPVRADWLESTIIGALRELLSDRDEALYIAEVMSKYTKGEANAAKLEQEKRRKRDAEKGIQNMMDAIAKGLDPTRAQDKLDELYAQAEEAGKRIEFLKRSPDFSIPDFADFLQFGLTLDDKSLLKAFIWQVIVKDEEVIVVLNYDVQKDEAAKIIISRVQENLIWYTKKKSKGAITCKQKIKSSQKDPKSSKQRNQDKEYRTCARVSMLRRLRRVLCVGLYLS